MPSLQVFSSHRSRDAAVPFRATRRARRRRLESEHAQNHGTEKLSRWRNVLVAAEDVVRVVAGLQSLEARECVGPEGGAHAVDGFVRLHVVRVAAADRPWLDRRRGLTRPGHALLVVGRIGPACHRTDVEGGVAVAEGGARRVDVFGPAVERLDQDSAGRTAERGNAAEQIVDQLVRELADEVTLPVVAVDAVTGIEDTLLLEEALAADAVADETGDYAERAEGIRILVPAGVARDDEELRGDRLVRGQLCLDAELARAVGAEIAKETERLADALTLVLEAPTDDTLERVKAEIGMRDHTEVPAASAKPPEQLGVLVLAHADDLADRGNELGRKHLVTSEPVLSGQVADSASKGETRDTGRADYAAGRYQAVGLGRGVEVQPGGAALARSDPVLGIHTDVPHTREVDYQAVVDRAVAGGVVASAADRDLEASSLAEG